MGAGRSQEAPYDLKASVPAGTYHFVLDCIIIANVDTKFELMHRRGSDNVVLASWTKSFEPLPDSFDAQPYEIGQTAPAIDFVAGDQLVFRYSATGTTLSEAWIPNGDGDLSGGRIPHILLPQ